MPDPQHTGLLVLIQKVSKRPAMYVGKYDYSRAVSFIEGFVFGRRPYVDEDEDLLLREFSSWLSEKLDRPKNWGWPTTIEDFYRDDEKALGMLPVLFLEFLNSR